MVAPPPLRRWLWPAAAALAAGFLGMVAFHGERREAGLARFEAKGLMAGVALSRVERVEVRASGPSWRFRRDSSGRWSASAEGAPDSAIAPQLDAALTLLQSAGPERVMEAAEIAGRAPAEFGLAPPALTVTVWAASRPPLVIHFGRRNPLGHAHYARVEERPEILLLPSYVGESWERVAGAR